MTSQSPVRPLPADDPLDDDSRNITRELKRRALAETCDYVEEHMFLVNAHFHDRYELLDYAIRQVCVNPGLWLEFGVYTGGTVRFIAERTTAPVYGFDSFEGNPDDWRSEYRRGAFALDRPPDFTGNIRLERGYFQDTLPGFVQRTTQPVAFLHIDCDLYTSTRTIFNHLGPRLVAGSIIVFDEFFNYPGWKRHEFKAFMEFIADSGKAFEYLGYVYRHSQVAVKILSD